MLDLRRFVPGGRVSTGLLAWCDGRLVWAVAQPKYWQQPDNVIPVVGIGGGQEPGESLGQAVAREAREEADVELRLLPARRTLWVKGQQPAEVCDLRAELSGEAAPLLIWQRRLELRGEDGVPYSVDYINAVFEAELLGQPRAGAEIPGLLWLTPELFLRMRSGPVAFDQLRRLGGDYQGSPLPPGCALQLQGSAWYLAEHWSDLQRG